MADNQRFVMYDPSCPKCGCGHQGPLPCDKPKQKSCACSNTMSLLGWLLIGAVLWYFFFPEDLGCSFSCLLDSIRTCRKKPPDRHYRLRLPTTPNVLQMYREYDG